jgi:hypothetical protein
MYPGKMKFYCLKNELDGAGGTYGGEESDIPGFVGRLEGKRPLRRSRRRFEDNIKIHLPIIELIGTWTGLI